MEYKYVFKSSLNGSLLFWTHRISVGLVELFKMPPEPIRSTERDACISSAQCPHRELENKSVFACHEPLTSRFVVPITMRKRGVIKECVI